VAELEGWAYAVFLPLLDGTFRASLQEPRHDMLILVTETGDPAVMGNYGYGIFIAVGHDPYTLLSAAARQHHGIRALARLGR